MLHILLTEKLGIDVELLPPLGNSLDMIRLLAGCNKTHECVLEERASGLHLSPPSVWAAAEIWITSKEEKRISRHVEDLGPIGYVSTPSLMTFSRVHEAAGKRVV